MKNMNSQNPDRTPVRVELDPSHAAQIRVRRETLQNVAAASIEGLQASQLSEQSQPAAAITEVPPELKVHRADLSVVPDIITEVPSHLKP